MNLIDVYLLLLPTLKQEMSNPFPIVLFISILPIILSVDYFVGMARKAGAEKAQTDAKVCSFYLCSQVTEWCPFGK